MTLDIISPVRSLDPAELRQVLEGDGEYALLDLREEGEFGFGHILLSSNIPWSRLEAEVRSRIPRLDVPVILVGDAAVVPRAALALGGLGYLDLSALAGGTEAWAAAGFELFDGGNVYSKAFAEVLEVEQHTPHISAAELERLRKEGADFVLLDSRTPEEFSRFHVPGAISAPGVELTARAEGFIGSPETLVVVSCAGRTRSIIGAQGLINFGIPNRVVSLEGGTQGWRIAGFTLETSPAGELPQLEGRTADVASERAQQLRDRYGIPLVTEAEVRAWLRQDRRTTYLIDIRNREEYQAGHLAGAFWVPGGQLVQTTDQWIGVRNARVVLTDTDGIRASIAAHWLKQYGHDISVLVAKGDVLSREAASGWSHLSDLPDVIELAAADAQAWVKAGAVLISADTSAEYQREHPAGALWRNRSQVARHGAGLPPGTTRIVVTSAHRTPGTLLAAELAQDHTLQIGLLVADADSWQAIGVASESSTTLADAERIDTLFWLHLRHSGNLAHSQAYLDWELELPARITRDGLARYSVA